MTTLAPAFDPALWPHEAVACNLCGRDDAPTICERDRYGLPTRVVQCACGLRYVSPRMTAEGYAAFYRDGYRALIAQIQKREMPLTELESDQRRYARDLLPRLLSVLPMNPTVLDVGGSTGIVGRAIQARWGGRVIVIDPSPDELARATGCETVCASAETATFPNGDVALVCRTLDHLLDPVGVLRRLRAAVPRLVVDAMHVDGWPDGWRYKVDHPYAFTADTLRATVVAAGWQPVTSWWRRGQHYVGLLCRRQED